MIESEHIEVDGKKLLGLRVGLEGAPLLLIIATKGYIMCRYLKLETAEKLGQVAAMVTGVRSFDDVLNAKISGLTENAKQLGINEGMLGRDALLLMS